jgi:hypothetical protein
MLVAHPSSFMHYQVPNKKLKPFVTSKSDVKLNRPRRPSEEYEKPWSVDDKICDISKTVFDPFKLVDSTLPQNHPFPINIE